MIRTKGTISGTIKKPRRKKGGKGSGLGGSLYQPHYPQRVYELTLLGLTQPELAKCFEVTEDTLLYWKERHPDFKEAWEKAKADADSKVASSLYHRAIGYSHDDLDIKIWKGKVIKTPVTKHYPPDTTAAIFWLKNRTRNHENPWSDAFKHEFSGPGGGPINLESAVKTDGLTEEEVVKLVQLGIKLRDNQQQEGIKE